jgi:hypothetical protein
MAGNRISDVPDQYNAGQYRQIVRDVETRFQNLEAAVSKYTVSNFTPTRTLNMATAGAPEIGNFLATLVSDMQKAGRLG